MATPMCDAGEPRFLELRSACPIVDGSNVSTPLLNMPQGKVVLFAMDAGQEMSEHRAPCVATVHVLEGRLRFAVGDEERVMGPDDWLVMPANAPHRLTAEEPTRFLLTLFKVG